MTTTGFAAALDRLRSRTRPSRTTTIGVIVALVTGTSMAGAVALGRPAAEPLRVTDDRTAAVPIDGAEPARAAEEPGTSSATVTLITGDRVRLDTVDGQETATVLPPEGTDADDPGSTYARFHWEGDLYVVPSEALPYLGTTLDPRLFDVSYLVEAGLADGESTTLPLVVQGEADDVPAIEVTGERRSGTGQRATVVKSRAAEFGELLLRRWRDSRAAGTTAGHLADVERITLARPTGAPRLPAAPTSAFSASASDEAGATKGGGTRYHTLTLDPIDQDGKPGVMVGWVHNLEHPDQSFLALASPGQGRTTFSVPEGTYSVEVSVFTGPADDFTTRAALVMRPEERVRSDRTIVLDARSAVPFDVELEDPPSDVDGLYRQDLLSFGRTNDRGEGAVAHAFGFEGVFAIIGMRLFSNELNGNALLHATPTRSVRTGELHLAAYTQLAESNSSSATAPSYRMVFTWDDEVPSTLTRRVRRTDLTTVRTRIHDNPTGQTTTHALSAYVYLPWTQAALGIGNTVESGDRVDYRYSTDPDATIWETRYRGDEGVLFTGERRVLEPGDTIEEVWNKSPDGPSPAAPYRGAVTASVTGGESLVTEPYARICVACRQGDVAMLYLRPYADSDPTHYGSSSTAPSKVEFARDGELAWTSDSLTRAVASPDRLALPMLPRAADYRVTWTQVHPGDDVARSVTDWRFRSAPSDPAADLPKSTQCTPVQGRRCSFLPLLFVRYDLALDTRNSAPAGDRFEIAFGVTGQQHAPVPTGVEATVQVSYDDGATWSEPAEAERRADGTFATTIDHPESGNFVSLRVRAHDSRGNAVEQTSIRAYRLTDR